MDREKIVIAIDGPAGAGKSTIAKKIAEILNLEYIDTGAMYRAITLKTINKKININHRDKIIELANNTVIDFKNNRIYLDGLDVTEEIRKDVVNKYVSYIAEIKEIREILVNMQRKMAENINVIMDGRDIGTVVLKNANFKFFLTASVVERARRRYLEIRRKGKENISYEEVLRNIKERDRIDSTRSESPLQAASDAYIIDTTNKSIDEITKEIIAHIERR